MKKLSIILLFSTAISLSFDFNMKNFKRFGVTINRIAPIKTDNPYRWAVGDCGKVFKLNASGYIEPGYPITLNEEYNLTGVTFEASGVYGYIVGYKRDGSDKWKGAVWKTLDGGQNWSVQYPIVVSGVNVPFLDVSVGPHDPQGRGVVWVSCGHGYVVRSTDGGAIWLIKPKPGGETHFGWLWGLWSDYSNPEYAWVCSDQSGLIAMTTNGGDIWISYK